MTSASAGPEPARDLSDDIDAVIAATVLEVRPDPAPVSTVSPAADPARTEVYAARMDVQRTLAGSVTGTTTVLFVRNRTPGQPWLTLQPGAQVLLFLRAVGEAWAPVDPSAPAVVTRPDIPPPPSGADPATAVRHELDLLVLSSPPSPIPTLLTALLHRIQIPDDADLSRSAHLDDPARRTAWAAIVLADGGTAALDQIADLYAGSGAGSPDLDAFVPVLVPLITDVDEPSAIPSLLRLVHGGSADLARAAAAALRGSAGSVESNVLVGLLDHPDQAVRYQAVLRLAAEDPAVDDGGPALDRYRADEDRYLGLWREWWSSR